MSCCRSLPVGIVVTAMALAVSLTAAAPDMFTALVDMQRALTDEQSAAALMKQYVDIERQRLQHLER